MFVTASPSTNVSGVTISLTDVIARKNYAGKLQKRCVPSNVWVPVLTLAVVIAQKDPEAACTFQQTGVSEQKALCSLTT